MFGRLLPFEGRFLKDPRATLAVCADIDKLESEADHVMRAAIAKLVREKPDAKQLIKLRSVHEILEQIIDASAVDHYVVFGARVGAIAWNVITWYYGIPSSSSHALIGGLAGAAIPKGGTANLFASGFLECTAAMWVGERFL